MTKLFIDIVGPKRRHIDFTGKLFRCPEEAGETAQLISLDLAVSDNSPWLGSEVQVKDAAGQCLFVYPVGPLQ
jgi:hypothetical protein